jgi:hypothetical protein
MPTRSDGSAVIAAAFGGSFTKADFIERSRNQGRVDDIKGKPATSPVLSVLSRGGRR